MLAGTGVGLEWDWSGTGVGLEWYWSGTGVVLEWDWIWERLFIQHRYEVKVSSFFVIQVIGNSTTSITKQVT